MEIVRADAAEDFDRGYIDTPGATTYHNFTGGVFDINITAPVFTNEYTYTFRLINLPTGADDDTNTICQDNPKYGCGSFSLMVDRTPPEVVTNSWLAEKGALAPGADGRIISTVLSTATYHCVDVQLQIKEQEAMFPGDLQLNWMFYSNTIDYTPWGEYFGYFGGEPATETLSAPSPGATLLQQLVWICGRSARVFTNPHRKPQRHKRLFSSSGSAVSILQDRACVWAVGHRTTDLFSPFSQASHSTSRNTNSSTRRPLFPSVMCCWTMIPVSERDETQVKVQNTGTMAGEAELIVKSVTDDGTPVVEKQFTTEELAPGDTSDWIEVTLEPFAEQTTGMYYTISLNGSSEPIYDGSSSEWNDVFNVKVQAEADDSSLLLIVVLLVVVIGVLGNVGAGALLGEEEVPPCSTKNTKRMRATKQAIAESKVLLQKFPQMSIPKWPVLCSNSRNGLKRKSKVLRPGMDRGIAPGLGQQSVRLGHDNPARLGRRGLAGPGRRIGADSRNHTHRGLPERHASAQRLARFGLARISRRGGSLATGRSGRGRIPRHQHDPCVAIGRCVRKICGGI